MPFAKIDFGENFPVFNCSNKSSSVVIGSEFATVSLLSLLKWTYMQFALFFYHTITVGNANDDFCWQIIPSLTAS